MKLMTRESWSITARFQKLNNNYKDMNKFDMIISKIGMDKLVHALVCALITFVVSLGVSVFFDDDAWVCAFIGGFSAFCFGLGKELADFFCNKPFDTKDLLADLVGSVLGFVIVGLLLMAV